MTSTIHVRDESRGIVFHLVLAGDPRDLSGAALASHVARASGVAPSRQRLEYRGPRGAWLPAGGALTGELMGLRDGSELRLRPRARSPSAGLVHTPRTSPAPAPTATPTAADLSELAAERAHAQALEAERFARERAVRRAALRQRRSELAAALEALHARRDGLDAAIAAERRRLEAVRRAASAGAAEAPLDLSAGCAAAAALEG